ncbi:ATP-binding protein [Geobacter sp. SVR]|uniref:ATP-binding protein n=1 Tax=Geobacter sp. SVR TaxID=2495594 RepID=UPI00143EFFA9|nr:ATP-binding protein [Geobacter sp. SVR]BCS52236.1 hypothetical protein GSVR_05440 [Geobacter sp. SVR]GCF85103.1 hypothetical protein GSbR_17030 [Geobacter sp. SVR]
MRHLAIRTKLICLVVFMSVVLIGVGVLGLNGMKDARTSLEMIYSDRLLCVIQLALIGEQFSDAVREMLQSVEHDRTGDDGTGMYKNHEQHAAKVEADLAEVDKTWRRYMASYLTPEEKVQADSTRSRFTDLVEQGIKPGIALMKSKDMAGLDAHIRNVVLPLASKTHAALDILIRLQGQMTESELAQDATKYRVRLTVYVIGIILAVVAGLVIGAVTTRSVTGSANLLRKRETHYRTLFESANDTLLIMSGTTVVDCNRKALEMFRGTREQVIGSSPASLSPDFQPDGKRSDEEVRRRISACLEGHSQLFEWQHRRLDGMLFDAEVALNLVEADGEGISLGILRDITDRKHHEQELLRARQGAEAANRTKSQFLANMSHELRTPMAGVLGMLELVLGGPLEEEQREFIATAHKSAGSIVGILNDILEMTRIEAGMFFLVEKPFDLRECVESAIDIFESEARRKRLDMILTMTGDLPERVVGDCLRLRQVLTNLVGNAVKFTEQGRVEIRIAAGGISHGTRRTFIFAVTDTGIGIPEDKRHLVFRSFSQVNGTHTRRYGGAGLGLTISKEIAERMGGTIMFDCAEGAGCTFTLSVPFGETGTEPHSSMVDRSGGAA